MKVARMIGLTALLCAGATVALAAHPGSGGLGGRVAPRQQDGDQQNAGETNQGLKTQIGTLIVTPGNGPSLAVADFVARSAGAGIATDIFNKVLWDDLKFQAVAAMVGKSLNPKTPVPDPASLVFDQWSADPARADYVAFGNLSGQSTALSADTYLFDVKTHQQILATKHSGDPRRMAHEFADEIVKILTGKDGIATSKVAYVQGNAIRVMDYDGFGGRTFASDGSIVLFPQFSPDGRYLAYVSYHSGVPNIVVRSADGGLIGGTHLENTTTSPSISPNGQLAYSSASPEDGSMEIFVSNLDGSGRRQLTHTRRTVNIAPRWNPATGHELAFISDRGGSPQVYVMDSSGANERLLISRGGHADSPSWSPDGRYIAFTWGGAGTFQVFVADVATAHLLELTGRGSNQCPSWSPDGRHLVFQSNRTGRWEIWQMHIDGSDQRQVSHGGGRLPTWSK